MSATSDQPGSSTATPAAGRTVIVLTLEKHREGVWITRLVAALAARHPTINVELVSVDSIDEGAGYIVNGRPRYDLVFNRVSDAAPPELAKTTAAVLQAATLWGIPTINGFGGYALCTNKVLHHQVMEANGLKTPRSAVMRMSATPSESEVLGTLRTAAERLLARGCSWPLLVKPNSAGFGEGIQPIANESGLAEVARAIAESGKPPSADGVLLLQEFQLPAGNAIYRVWFLGGKIQCAAKLVRHPAARSAAASTASGAAPTAEAFTGGCAGGVCSIKRKSAPAPVPVPDADAFTGGCAGGVCSRPKKRPKPAVEESGESEEPPPPTAGTATSAGPAADGSVGLGQSAPPVVAAEPEALASSAGERSFTSWAVPKDVHEDILRLVAACPDCDCGSVEFMYPTDGSTTPLYFDLNFCSTLPLMDGSIEDRDRVWADDFDPWAELADFAAAAIKA